MNNFYKRLPEEVEEEQQLKFHRFYIIETKQSKKLARKQVLYASK